jgi:hypothetical protein
MIESVVRLGLASNDVSLQLAIPLDRREVLVEVGEEAGGVVLAVVAVVVVVVVWAGGVFGSSVSRVAGVSDDCDKPRFARQCSTKACARLR